jgi:phosphatidate cytidylyltransferase
MAALALLAAWWGGVPFLLFWTAAAVAVLVEWLGLCLAGRPLPPILAGCVAIVVAALAAFAGSWWACLAAVGIGAAAVYGLAGDGASRRMAALGVPYAAAMVVPVVALRADAALGALAIVYLFALVWGTDILAYFTGRTFGGPKLWPRVSPKKTWSGFIGGTVSGALLATGVAALAGLPALPVLFLLALVLAVLSQGGDLFESSMKRHFGAKDASSLIPGHGGVMDRLDGFVAAAVAAALLAALRSPDELAGGLLLWP